MERALDNASVTQLSLTDETPASRAEPTSSVQPPRPLGPGDVVGAYRIVSEIGRGAMGVVFLAIDEQLERKVALKVIHANLLSDRLRELFKNEARAMALVNDSHVLTIHAFGEYESVPYFVMEFVEGETVQDWLERTPLPPIDVALNILSDVSKGIAAIHAAGAIHRDIKPSNLLLDSSLRARVADFGLAMPARDQSAVREVAGTPAYMAPEIAFNGTAASSPTIQSDVYSLACVAYELLTGHPPFAANNEVGVLVQHATMPVPRPSSLRPDLPAAFDSVLLKALEKKPEDRTPSAELFRRCLLEARRESLEPVRILVAEDDDDFRDLLGLILRREFPGADVECVRNGAQLLECFDNKPASAILIDLQMPELDGFSVTKMLRARPNAANVPIIVLTAAGGPQEWARLSALGADRFMVKPVNLEDVVTLTRRAVRERSSWVPDSKPPRPPEAQHEQTQVSLDAAEQPTRPMMR
jgi:serine/threonine-protein kinase